MVAQRRSARRGHEQHVVSSSSSAAATEVSTLHNLRSASVSDNDLVSVPHDAAAPVDPSDQHGRSTPAGSAASTGSAKPKRVRVMTDKRREQCRVNQARYRKKLARSDANLDVEVNRLRMDIIHLEDRRRTLYNAMDARESRARVILEYFRLFRHGFRPSESVHDPQTAFVMASFHPTVRVGETHGCEAFLEQTRVFTVFYDDPCTDLVRYVDWSATKTDTTFNTTLHTTLTVSDTTIRQVFPHLLRDEHSVLRQKLLGQHLKFDAWGRFVLDEAGKVLEYDWGMDFIGVLRKFLTLEETATVLGQARTELEISEDLVETSAKGDDRFEIV